MLLAQPYSRVVLYRKQKRPPLALSTAVPALSTGLNAQPPAPTPLSDLQVKLGAVCGADATADLLPAHERQRPNTLVSSPSRNKQTHQRRGGSLVCSGLKPLASGAREGEGKKGGGGGGGGEKKHCCYHSDSVEAENGVSRQSERAKQGAGDDGTHQNKRTHQNIKISALILQSTVVIQHLLFDRLTIWWKEQHK